MWLSNFILRYFYVIIFNNFVVDFSYFIEVFGNFVLNYVNNIIVSYYIY